MRPFIGGSRFSILAQSASTVVEEKEKINNAIKKLVTKANLFQNVHRRSFKFFPRMVICM